MARGSINKVSGRSSRKASPPGRKTSAEGGAPRKKRGKPPKTSGKGPMARAPDNSDELKARIGALMSATSRIRSLKRAMNANFWEIGEILQHIEQGRLHEAKGFPNLETFVSRELDLAKNQGMKILKVTRTFQRAAAQAAGLERAMAALAALEGEEEAAASPQLPKRSASTVLPAHKR